MSSPHDASDARLLTDLNRPVYLVTRGRQTGLLKEMVMSAASTTTDRIGHRTCDGGDLRHRPSDRGAPCRRRLGGHRARPQPRTWRRGSPGDRGAGGPARFVAADLNDLAAVRGLIDEVGDGDVLVNNAGASWFGPTADLDEATFDDLFDGNVRSAYFLVAGWPRAWLNAPRGASSTWPAWPARSAWTAGPPTEPPRPRSAP